MSGLRYQEQRALRLIGIVITSLVGSIALASQTKPASPYPKEADPLGVAMRKLGVHTVLLLASQAVDETPLWSPDSRFVAANFESRWHQLDTWAVTTLAAAKWHGEVIGLTKDDLQSNATGAEVSKWKDKSHSNPREAVSKSGFRVQLTQKELSTSFVISKGSRSRTLWATGLENCYSPVFSPNEKYVAFICELNGVFVTDVDAAFRAP